MMDANGLAPLKSIRLEGKIDGVNKIYDLPGGVRGEFFLTICGQILEESSDYTCEAGRVRIIASPESEVERPRIYLVKKE